MASFSAVKTPVPIQVSELSCLSRTSFATMWLSEWPPSNSPTVLQWHRPGALVPNPAPGRNAVAGLRLGKSLMHALLHALLSAFFLTFEGSLSEHVGVVSLGLLVELADNRTHQPMTAGGR